MHILFIDNLEKLVVKKDSTLMMGLSMLSKGLDVALLFEENFSITTADQQELSLWRFAGEFENDYCHLKRFEKKSTFKHTLTSQDTIHMRLDPPFDTRYLKFLWMLDFLQQKGVNVVNRPQGILNNNEKILAYSYPQFTTPTYVGADRESFFKWAKTIETDYLILKPLDLYQGIGVEKVQNDENILDEVYSKKIKQFQGAIIAQPYLKEVESGEMRAVYFKGEEIGSIIKVPPEGSYLANIAQGAKYKAYKLTESERAMCEKVCLDLSQQGLDWLAFDILGGKLSEVNITCPGLMVEVSMAYQKNLCLDMIDIGFI